MIRIYFLVLLVFCFFSCSHSSYRKTSSDFSGYEDFLFGFELTFTYKDLDLCRNDDEKDKLEMETIKNIADGFTRIHSVYTKKIEKDFPVTVSEIRFDTKKLKIFFKIKIPEYFSLIERELNFVIFPDYCSYEVIFDRVTLRELLTLKSFLNENVFKTFKKLDFEPHASLGGGHINLDINQNFSNDYAYFRNFIIDILNHEFLAMGLFRKKNSFSLPFHERLKNERTFIEDLKSFKKKIEKLDQIYQRKPSEVSARDLVKELESIFSRPSNSFRLHSGMNANLRLEWRVPPPQKNVDDMIYFSEFLAKRILYIKKKYDKDRLLLRLKTKFSRLIPPFLLLKNFKRYVSEMEENPNWDKHFHYLSEDVREAAKNYRD